MRTMRESKLDPKLLPAVFTCDPEVGTIIIKERPLWSFKSLASYSTHVAHRANKPWPLRDDHLGRRVGNIPVIKVNNVLACRVAWALYHGAWPVGFVYFANGDPTDLKKCNLVDTASKAYLPLAYEAFMQGRHVRGLCRLADRKLIKAQRVLKSQRECKLFPITPEGIMDALVWRQDREKEASLA